VKLQENMTGFYYVGTKRAIVTKLVNIYKRGYASGKLNESMTELLNKNIFCHRSLFATQLMDLPPSKSGLICWWPLPLYEAENLTTDELAKRFMAPAGMTVLLMDMWIMAHTPQALMQKANT
jgi:hypothetical protein